MKRLNQKEFARLVAWVSEHREAVEGLDAKAAAQVLADNGWGVLGSTTIYDAMDVAGVPRRTRGQRKPKVAGGGELEQRIAQLEAEISGARTRLDRLEAYVVSARANRINHLETVYEQA